jgi:hypothetical protein
MRAAEESLGRKKCGGRGKKWWNKAIEELVHRKKDAYRKWLNSSSVEHKKDYRELSRKVKGSVEEAEKRAWEEFGKELQDHFSKWEIHADKMCKKARQRLGLLRILRRNKCPTSWCWTVYATLIRSITTYPCPTWCNLTAKNMVKLLHVEKSAERIIGTNPPIEITSFIQRMCAQLVMNIK